MKGIAAAFAVDFFVVVSATSVQLLERHIPDFELNIFRNLVPLIVSILGKVVLRDWRWPFIDRDKIRVTSAYVTLTFVSGSSFFISMALLPASMVASISKTSSIISSLILFGIFWDETADWKKVSFALCCIAGVILVVQPWGSDAVKAPDTGHSVTWSLNNHPGNDSINYYHESSRSRSSMDLVSKTMITATTSTGSATTTATTQRTKTVATAVTTTVNLPTTTTAVAPSDLIAKLVNTPVYASIIGCGFAIVAGGTLSVDILLVKRHPFFNDHRLDIVLWIYLTSLCYSSILMLIVETPVLPSNWFDITMVTVHSITYAVIWPLCIYAPKYISGNTISLIYSAEVGLMLIPQYTVLSRVLPGHRNWMEVLGVLLVLVGSSGSLVTEIVKC